MVRFQKTIFQQILMILYKYLVVLGRLWGQFRKIYGRRGSESEKWTPKVACRRGMACIIHIISLCVRPKGAHKQELRIFATYFGCPKRARVCQERKRLSGPGHFGATLVPFWGHFGVTLSTSRLLRGDFNHLRITFESHWSVFKKQFSNKF